MPAIDWVSVGQGLQASVRPIVTFIFAAAIVLGFLQGRLSGETFMGTAGVIMAFWFGQRAEQRTEQRAELRPEK
jgi:hypothetical protein